MNNKKIKLFTKTTIAACLMTVGSVAIVSAATVSQYRSNGGKACTTGNFGPDNSGYLTMCIYTNTNNNETVGTDPTSVFLEYYAYRYYVECGKTLSDGKQTAELNGNQRAAS